MIRYLIFDSIDTEGWDDLDNRILSELKKNDSSILATKYSLKRYSIDMTKCLMSIDITNEKIIDALNHYEINSLVELSMNDEFWNPQL